MYSYELTNDEGDDCAALIKLINSSNYLKTLLVCFFRGSTIFRNDSLLVCAVCRATTNISQVSYVQSKASEKNIHLLDVPNIQLKRSVSVKVKPLLSLFQA